MGAKSDQFVTSAKAGEILGVNDSRIRQFILSGRLKAKKFGNSWMIGMDAIREFKRQNPRTPGRPKGGK